MTIASGALTQNLWIFFLIFDSRTGEVLGSRNDFKVRYTHTPLTLDNK